MPKTILYVEDELWLMRGMIVGLEAAGYEVITAQNATEALDTLEEHRDEIDLVLMDIRMPTGPEVEDRTGGRRAGVELSHMLRKRGIKIPILVLTVVTSPHTLYELQEIGIPVVEKPALPSEVATKIKALIGEQGT